MPNQMCLIFATNKATLKRGDACASGQYPQLSLVDAASVHWNSVSLFVSGPLCKTLGPESGVSDYVPPQRIPKRAMTSHLQCVECLPSSQCGLALTLVKRFLEGKGTERCMRHQLKVLR